MIKKLHTVQWILLMTALLILSACSGFRLKDALAAGNFETIRYASHFTDSDDSLTREEFAEYKDLIVQAIKNNGANGITLKNTLKGEVLYISPFQLTITDLSPDLKILLNGKELQNDYRANQVKTILNPGENEIKFVLSTNYLTEEKTVKIDTQDQPSRDLILASGFGFRTLTVTAKEAGSYLNINGQDYILLEAGINRIGYIPSLPLKIKTVSQTDPSLTSKEILVENGMNEAVFALTERATTQPMETGSTQVMTQPVVTAAPGSTLPAGSGEIPHVDPILSVNRLLQAYVNDLNTGDYKELAQFVQPGSALEKQWKNEIVAGRGSSYIFLGTENAKTTLLSDSKGFIDIHTRIRVHTKDGKTKEPFLRYRYYFNVQAPNLLFYQEMQL